MRGDREDHMGMKFLVVAAAMAAAAGPALAQTTSYRLRVLATDNIYGAGSTSAPGGGTVPAGVIDLPAGAECVTVNKVTGSFVAPDCESTEGCITVNKNEPTNYNDPDGNYAQVKKSSNSGTGQVSGITAPGAGYLVGLFTQGTPSGTAPAALDFTTGTKTKFLSLSPLIDQTFFVGDGRKKDGSGPHQTFVVPAGATALYFGISDACGYAGGPSCYFDNYGHYEVKATVSTAACTAP
jgi:hypothetical protein